MGTAEPGPISPSEALSEPDCSTAPPGEPCHTSDGLGIEEMQDQIAHQVREIKSTKLMIPRQLMSPQTVNIILVEPWKQKLCLDGHKDIEKCPRDFSILS